MKKEREKDAQRKTRFLKCCYISQTTPMNLIDTIDKESKKKKKEENEMTSLDTRRLCYTTL